NSTSARCTVSLPRKTTKIRPRHNRPRLRTVCKMVEINSTRGRESDVIAVPPSQWRGSCITQKCDGDLYFLCMFCSDRLNGHLPTNAGCGVNALSVLPVGRISRAWRRIRQDKPHHSL